MSETIIFMKPQSNTFIADVLRKNGCMNPIATVRDLNNFGVAKFRGKSREFTVRYA